MRLIACQNCHAQYDTTTLKTDTFDCRCGATVSNVNVKGIDARILRCGACGAGVEESAERCAYCAVPIVRDKRKLSLICPECYGRNTKDTRFCTSCGVAIRPQSVASEGRELPCPACQATMPPHNIGNIPVNECHECHGLWLGREYVDILVNRTIKSRRAREAAGEMLIEARRVGGNPMQQKVVYRQCPECEKQMARRNFRRGSGVIIDRCPGHGTWLDADELEQIAGYLTSSSKQGMDINPSLEMERSADGLQPTVEYTQRTQELLEQRKRRRDANTNIFTTRFETSRGPGSSSLLEFLSDLIL
jgi:Zn-finger nucleic acid-binding protein